MKIAGQRLSGEQLNDLQQAREDRLTPQQKHLLAKARAEAQEADQALREAQRRYVAAAERSDLHKAEAANRRLAEAKLGDHAAQVKLAVTEKSCGLRS